MYLSVSSNEPIMKSESSGVVCHVAPEPKIQLVNCKLSQKISLLHSSLTYIRSINAYIFWSLRFLPLLLARLPFSLKSTCFCCFLLSLGGFGHFAIRWSSYPYLKHFWGVSYVCLLSAASTAWAFSFSFPILLKYFSAEWFLPPRNVHFVWKACALSLFPPKPELMPRFS